MPNTSSSGSSKSATSLNALPNLALLIFLTILFIRLLVLRNDWQVFWKRRNTLQNFSEERKCFQDFYKQEFQGCGLKWSWYEGIFAIVMLFSIVRGPIISIGVSSFLKNNVKHGNNHNENNFTKSEVSRSKDGAGAGISGHRLLASSTLIRYADNLFLRTHCIDGVGLTVLVVIKYFEDVLNRIVCSRRSPSFTPADFLARFQHCSFVWLKGRRLLELLTFICWANWMISVTITSFVAVFFWANNGSRNIMTVTFLVSIACTGIKFVCFANVAHSFHQALATNFDGSPAGLVVNSALAIRLIIIQSAILAIRILYLRVELNGQLKEICNFPKLVSRFKKFVEIYPHFSSNLFGRCSKNQLVFFLVSVVSIVEHSTIALLVQTVEENSNSSSALELFGRVPRKVETVVEYFSSLLNDINALDGFALLILLMLKGMENGVELLNEILTKILKKLSNRKIWNRRFESGFSEPFSLAATPEDGIERSGTYTIRDVSLLYHDILEIWGHLTRIVSLVTAISFSMWMIQLIFNGFFAVTAAVDFGVTSIFPVSFSGDCLIGFLRFVCVTNSVHTFRAKVSNMQEEGIDLQLERIN
ncbi:unnamed protein product [Orchesella dallaii]|uniref:Gustatory receptor n=1 Tax=Orchesella dallaii TaxID=48710 RepID=A0ABP1R515_9HEXA